MKKKILIINNGLAGGGIERASVSLANYFESKGYSISVVALYKSDPFFQLNKKIQFYEPSFDRIQFNKYFYLLKMMLFLRSKVKKIQPDTILAFSEWTNPFVILALKGLSIPLFISDRMNPLAKLPLISEFLRKNLYKKASGIIAQSNFAKSVLQKKTKAKNIHVIYNPVNVIEKIDSDVKNRIVTVGRLEEVKGHRYLIEAFSRISDKSWQLSIVGNGSLKHELENLASSLGVGDRILFHGHLTDFRLQLSEAKIFVLPSLKEGFPNALLEAMSVPLPCITTDFFHGKNEIIENGINGLIVKPADVKELTDALELLIRDESLRDKLAKNAIKVREVYNFNNIANQYLNFILPEHA